MDSGDVFFFGPFIPFFGRQSWQFLGGLTKCQNCGANVGIEVQRGICNEIIKLSSNTTRVLENLTVLYR